MPAMTPVPKDHPLVKAWEAYKRSDDFANSKLWAPHAKHVDGSLWGAFMAGWKQATERAGNLHEQVNPASDAERLNGSPGAGAMGAIIQYRDLIRSDA